MLYRHESKTNYIKILSGHDTDVSICTIVRLHPGRFVMTNSYIDDETGDAKSYVYDWDSKKFKEEFDLQYGSPMMYISHDDYKWMIE